MGLVMATDEVYGPLMEQSLDDAQVFPEMAQGISEVDPVGLLHPGAAAGAQPQAEAPRRQLRQHLHLLRHRDGMTWEGLGNGCAEQNMLRAEGGTDECAEGVGPTSAGAGEPG